MDILKQKKYKISPFDRSLYILLIYPYISFWQILISPFDRSWYLLLLEPIDDEEEIAVRYFPQNFQEICNQTGWTKFVFRHPPSQCHHFLPHLSLIIKHQDDKADAKKTQNWCKKTQNWCRLSPNAMRRLYRGFKTDCPSGLVILIMAIMTQMTLMLKMTMMTTTMMVNDDQVAVGRGNTETDSDQGFPEWRCPIYHHCRAVLLD